MNIELKEYVIRSPSQVHKTNKYFFNILCILFDIFCKLVFGSRIDAFPHFGKIFTKKGKLNLQYKVDDAFDVV